MTRCEKMAPRRSSLGQRIVVGLLAIGIAGLGILLLVPRLGRESNQNKVSSSTVPATQVVCDDAGTHVTSTSANAQTDGVHFQVSNLTGQTVSFGGPMSSLEVPPGTSNVAISLPGGPQAVTCANPQRDALHQTSLANIDVIDDQGLWRPDTLECSGWIENTPKVGGTPFRRDDPLDLARSHLNAAGVSRAGDAFARAGYPEQRDAVVILERGGKRIARVAFLSDRNGGVKISLSLVCAEVMPN